MRFLLTLLRFPIAFIVIALFISTGSMAAILYRPISRAFLETEIVAAFSGAFAIEPLNVQLADQVEKNIKDKLVGVVLPEVLPNPFK